MIIQLVCQLKFKEEDAH